MPFVKKRRLLVLLIVFLASAAAATAILMWPATDHRLFVYTELKKLKEIDSRPASENSKIAAELRQKLDSLPFPYLYEYARRVADSNPEEAMVTFSRAGIRMRYDAYRCADQTARQGIRFWPPIAKNVVELAQSDAYKARIGELGLRAVALEQKVPIHYQPFAICFHGMDAMVAAIDKKPVGNLYVPESEWPQVHADVLQKATKSFQELHDSPNN